MVHLYSAKALPPADESGVLDPYVLLKIEDQAGKGREKRTHHLNATASPQFSTTLELDDLPLPAHAELSPPLTINVFDHDDVGADDLVSVLQYVGVD